MFCLPEFSCKSREYCKGRRLELHTANTWRRHLREAGEDEEDTIRLAGCSEAFWAFLSATSGSNASTGPLKLALCSRDKETRGG